MKHLLRKHVRQTTCMLAAIGLLFISNVAAQNLSAKQNVKGHIRDTESGEALHVRECDYRGHRPRHDFEFRRILCVS